MILQWLRSWWQSPPPQPDLHNDRIASHDFIHRHDISKYDPKLKDLGVAQCGLHAYAVIEHWYATEPDPKTSNERDERYAAIVKRASALWQQIAIRTKLVQKNNERTPGRFVILYHHHSKHRHFLKERPLRVDEHNLQYPKILFHEYDHARVVFSDRPMVIREAAKGSGPFLDISDDENVQKDINMAMNYV